MVLGAKNARLTMLAGFTTVREAGSEQQTAYSLRRGTAEGILAGPRIVAAGPPLSIVGGHGDVSGFKPEVNAVLTGGYTCTGAVECAEKVRRASQNGAEIIKITATGGVLSQQGRGLEAHFSDAEMKSIADTAHSLGLKVVTHALYVINSSAGLGIASPAIWTIEALGFLTMAVFALVALARSATAPVVWASVALGGVFNVIQAGMGLAMFGPLRLGGEAMAPAFQAVRQRRCSRRLRC